MKEARTSASSLACSNTVTLWPPRAQEIAAAKPPSPAPITTMSKDEEVAEGMVMMIIRMFVEEMRAVRFV